MEQSRGVCWYEGYRVYRYREMGIRDVLYGCRNVFLMRGA
jgi:hypothetical protein